MPIVRFVCNTKDLDKKISEKKIIKYIQKLKQTNRQLRCQITKYMHSLKQINTQYYIQDHDEVFIINMNVHRMIIRIHFILVNFHHNAPT